MATIAILVKVVQVTILVLVVVPHFVAIIVTRHTIWLRGTNCCAGLPRHRPIWVSNSQISGLRTEVRTRELQTIANWYEFADYEGAKMRCGAYPLRSGVRMLRIQIYAGMPTSSSAVYSYSYEFCLRRGAERCFRPCESKKIVTPHRILQFADVSPVF